MKQKSPDQDPDRKLMATLQQAAATDLEQNESILAATPDEVSRRAYFTYLNEGSRPGRDVQHWLDAEAQMLAERDRTRVHGFHNRN